MISMKEWMELVNYRITEGSDYCWTCYGPTAYTLDSWDGNHDGHSFSIIFDTRTQEVYEVQAHDYLHNRAYRMFNPDFKFEHDSESASRGTSSNEAWDDLCYVDLEIDDDFIQKCLAIQSGEDYDTRVSVPVDFTDQELLTYMKMAHDRDITFNEFVEDALRNAIEEVRAGRLTKEHAESFLDQKVDFPLTKKQKKKLKRATD